MNNENKYLILFVISVITFIIVIVSVPQYLRQQQESILTTTQAINKSNEVILTAIDNLYIKLDTEADNRTAENKLIVKTLEEEINEGHTQIEMLLGNKTH